MRLRILQTGFLIGQLQGEAVHFRKGETVMEQLNKIFDALGEYERQNLGPEYECSYTSHEDYEPSEWDKMIEFYRRS